MFITDWSPLGISLKVSLVTMAITLGLGTTIAYRMYTYHGNARSVIETILLLPLVLPPTVIGFVLLIVFGRYGFFGSIAIPLAMPGIVAGAVLSFARALGEFGATLMLAGNIPGQTQTMPMAIYFAVESGAIQEGWFWTIIVTSISLIGISIINSRNT